MDNATLGAALALAKSVPGTAVAEAQAAATRAETAAKTVESSTASIAVFESLGLTLQDGKICQKVERG